MITVIDTLMESFSAINFDQNLLLVLAITPWVSALCIRIAIRNK